MNILHDEHRFGVGLCVFLSFLISVGALCAQEEGASEVHVVEWETDLFPGGGLPLVDSVRKIALGANPDGISVVAGDTAPSNPFADVPQALRVFSSGADSFWFRMYFRPFESMISREGAFAVDLVPVSGAINFQIGFNEVPWQPENASTYHVKKHLFSVSFRPDEPVLIQGKPSTGGVVDVVESGKLYRLLIKWNLRTSPSGFSVFVNGEQMSQAGHHSAEYPASSDSLEHGINTFRISNGSATDHEGEFFLGRLRVLYGPTDLGEGNEPQFTKSDAVEMAR